MKILNPVFHSTAPQTPISTIRTRLNGFFSVFAEGGVVQLPLQKTFWADRYGMVTGQFGTPWEVNCTAAGD